MSVFAENFFPLHYDISCVSIWKLVCHHINASKAVHQTLLVLRCDCSSFIQHGTDIGKKTTTWSVFRRPGDSILEFQMGQCHILAIKLQYNGYISSETLSQERLKI